MPRPQRRGIPPPPPAARSRSQTKNRPASAGEPPVPRTSPPHPAKRRHFPHLAPAGAPHIRTRPPLPPPCIGHRLIPVFCGQVREQHNFSLARQRLAPLAHPAGIHAVASHRTPPSRRIRLPACRTAFPVHRQNSENRMHFPSSVVIYTNPADIFQTPRPAGPATHANESGKRPDLLLS